MLQKAISLGIDPFITARANYWNAEIEFLSSIETGILSVVVAIIGIGRATDAATTMAAVANLSDLIFIIILFWR